VRYGLFPVEVVALCALLWRAGSVVVLIVLPFSQIIEFARARKWHLAVAIVGSPERYRHALHEYYVVYFPLGFLVAAVMRHPVDSVVLVTHLALFPMAFPRNRSMSRHAISAPSSH
jgi:hypothetical protein